MLKVERILVCQDEECGEDLPEQRIADRRIRCTPCEAAMERRNKQRRTS